MKLQTKSVDSKPKHVDRGFLHKKQIDQPIYQLFTKITKQLSKAQGCQKYCALVREADEKVPMAAKKKDLSGKIQIEKKNKKYWQKPIYAQNIEPPGT